MAKEIPVKEAKDKDLRCQHPYLDGTECGHDPDWKLYWVDGEVRCEDHIELDNSEK